MIRYDILLCGIGGQGVISLGTILKLSAIKDGLMVIGAERTGGAQREGVVTSNVRYRGFKQGEEQNERSFAGSGLIPLAGADMMIAMEPLEALRHARYLNENSVVIINDFPLMPVSVRMGNYSYPETEEIYNRLRKFTNKVHVFNIDEISKKNFHTLRQVNTLSLGLAFALGELPVSDQSLLDTIQKQFPDFNANKRAFELGMEIAGYS